METKRLWLRPVAAFLLLYLKKFKIIFTININQLKKLRFFLIFSLTLAAFFVLYSLTLSERKGALVKEVIACNSTSTNLRFSCYRNVIEKYYAGNLTRFISDIKSPALDASFRQTGDISYAIFGTNCHTFYHAAGDFIATSAKDKDLKTLVNYCPATCTSGCLMGLYKRLALANNFSDEVLSKYYDACPEGSEHQCAHEIGHNLHDKYVQSILGVLDEISYKNYGLATKNYNYVTFPKANVDAPFEDCLKFVPEDELPYCLTGTGHNLFLFSEFDQDGYKSAFRDCDSTKEENKNNCYAFLVYRIGINDVATKFLSEKFEEGRKICNEVVALSQIKEMKRHCYLGIGGGVGLFIDSEYTNIKITDQNLAQIQKEVLQKINLCEESESDLKKECYKGLLGTKLRRLYSELNLQNIIIEELLPQIESDFEVVG